MRIEQQQHGGRPGIRRRHVIVPPRPRVGLETRPDHRARQRLGQSSGQPLRELFIQRNHRRRKIDVRAVAIHHAEDRAAGRSLRYNHVVGLVLRPQLLKPARRPAGQRIVPARLGRLLARGVNVLNPAPPLGQCYSASCGTSFHVATSLWPVYHLNVCAIRGTRNMHRAECCRSSPPTCTRRATTRNRPADTTAAAAGRPDRWPGRPNGTPPPESPAPANVGRVLVGQTFWSPRGRQATPAPPTSNPAKQRRPFQRNAQRQGNVRQSEPVIAEQIGGQCPRSTSRSAAGWPRRASVMTTAPATNARREDRHSCLSPGTTSDRSAPPPQHQPEDPQQAEAKDELGTHARQHQVVRQSLEDIDLVGLRGRLRIDAPVERERRDQSGQRQQQPAQETRPEGSQIGQLASPSTPAPLPPGDGVDLEPNQRCPPPPRPTRRPARETPRRRRTAAGRDSSGYAPAIPAPGTQTRRRTPWPRRRR